ncbi:hypothetical protein D9M70_570210 [compost metagenome]
MAAFEPDNSQYSDGLARSEAVAFEANDDLDKDGKKQEHGRHQKFRDHANLAAIILLWGILGCTMLGVTVFVLHMILPAQCQWLSPEKLDKLQTLLGAALLSSAMTGYVNKRMS